MRRNPMLEKLFAHEFAVNSAIFFPFTLLHIAMIDPNAIMVHPAFAWAKLIVIQIGLPAGFALWRLMRRKKNRELQKQVAEQAELLQEAKSIFSLIKHNSAEDKGAIAHSLAELGLSKFQGNGQSGTDGEED